jgi:hypothetical protein
MVKRRVTPGDERNPLQVKWGSIIDCLPWEENDSSVSVRE